MKIAILFGGCDGERDISLNSARSVYDHLSTDEYSIELIYISSDLTFCHLPPNWIYSNTTDDFDHHCMVNYAINKDRLKSLLQDVDIAIPLAHGQYGEGGELQRLLESFGVLFIGTRASKCMDAYCKTRMHEMLKKGGFETYPNLSLSKNDSLEHARTKVSHFFNSLKPNHNVVIKPSRSGSSIGVYLCDSVDSIIGKYLHLKVVFDDQPIIIEPYMNGKEFTVCLVETNGSINTFEPTEINKTPGSIFDYHQKYFPTESVKWTIPMNINEGSRNEIKQQAISIFRYLGLSDYARLDGWIMDDGTVYFSDINIIPGMDQNSFFFIQALHASYSHSEVLNALIANHIHIDRYDKKQLLPSTRQNIDVIMGGYGNEQHVSLMSGLNVYLKLKSIYSDSVRPYFLYDEKVYCVKPWMLLCHTTHEVMNHIRQHPTVCVSIDRFIDNAKENNRFIFMGLHGGDAENGIWQSKCEKAGVNYNG